MGARHITLAVSIAVVLALSLYLFVKVKAAPAQPSADAIAEGARHAPQPPPVAADDGPAIQRSSSDVRAEATRQQLVGSGVARVEPPPSGPTPALQDQGPIDNSNVDEDLKNADGQTVANKLFDRGDWDEATKQALKMLDADPKNARMLRIVISTACFEGDQDRAQKYWSMLTEERDKVQMATRCGRYQIQLKQ